MSTSAPEDDEDDEEEEGEGEASVPPSPAVAPGNAKAQFISTRTLRGLGVALGVAGVVLLHYHVVRPWFAEHHIRTSVDEDVACALKAVLAFSAIAMSVWALMRRLAGHPFPKRIVTLALVVFGGLGVAAYVGSDDLGASNFVHRWELFHYYLGSKYPRELGYKRLYTCAAVAQSELDPGQRAEVMARKIRDLETDIIQEAAPVLEHPEECKRHFSPQRWKAFKKDVAWFRHSSSRSFWEGMQTDHGYNPPPVWTMSGHFFGAFFPAATTQSMGVLASLDTIVFALTFFFVWWGFGLETCCLVLVFWGTQFPANGYFTGGAFLRQDWLMFLVMSACLLRKRYWALAGAALATSALLRVFPALFFAGIGLVALSHLYKHKRFAKHHLRVFAGAALATVVLVTGSVAVAGEKSYEGFVEHIALHHRTPLTNNMGLSVLLSYTQAGRAEFTRDKNLLDEFGKWADAHSAALARRRPMYLSLNGFFLVVFIMAVRRIKTLWIAMGLSAILLVTIPSLTCYYYSFFLVPALLSKASRVTGGLTLLAAGISSVLVLWPRVSYQWDDRFTTQSFVFLAFALVLVLGFLHELPKRKPPVPPSEALRQGPFVG
jgi:hypothetical protein